MLRDGTKVDVGVLEQKRKEHEQLLNGMIPYELPA